MYRFHGESGDADEAAVLKSLPEIQNTIKKYALNDVWNADEFGLFFKMAPKTTIGQGRLPGRKVQKDRVTFMGARTLRGQKSSLYLSLENQNDQDVLIPKAQNH